MIENTLGLIPALLSAAMASFWRWVADIAQVSVSPTA